MHLKYPRKRDFYTWEELRCLAKALGFRKDLFHKNVSHESEKDKSNGLSTKSISNMLDIKCLHGDIHRTYNMHDALYNSRVIEKAVEMLSKRYLSFQELREVRVAFQLYEHEDMLGLVTDEHTLLRTLKICGRAVSPVKLKQHIKHMKRQVADRIMLYEFLDLLLLCERDTEVQLQPLPLVTGVDKNNLYKLCDFQAVLCTEDEKRIRHLDTLYEQGSFRSSMSHNKDVPSWRLLYQDYFVDSNPRIELVSRQQQRSMELCDHLDHSNKKVMQARCGYTGTSQRTAFVDLNDVSRKLKPLERPPLKFELQQHKEEVEDEKVTKDKEHYQKIDLTRLSASSVGSFKFYREFDGTTSAKLSRTSKLGHQGILVTPRDLYNSHVMSQNLQWDMETQSQRLKQISDKHMKEKYSSYYKKLKVFQDPVQNPESEGSRQSKEMPETSTTAVKPADSDPVELVITPRKQVPKLDSIYDTLMERLQKTDTLLDFGEVRVQEFGSSMPSNVSGGHSLTTQKLRVEQVTPQRFGVTGKVRLQRLGSLRSTQPKETGDSEKQDEVEQLLEKLQEAKFVASGKKGFLNPKAFVFAK
ncbi:uncharacterized protein LOC111322836 isoform X2 [Stylophora pistillata]|uniref:uncharacterized protein LOC111322836 isoform X2 n=1 Tax=Stylophora pistillata TaxID=50429 RepID=UPI000C0393B3|nr:uncharacterized protein LOC111322836 isoform X2 [Stylophora pistillata]